MEWTFVPEIYVCNFMHGRDFFHPFGLSWGKKDGIECEDQILITLFSIQKYM